MWWQKRLQASVICSGSAWLGMPGTDWNESNPYFSDRVGFIPGGIGPRSSFLFQGPAALASITHSIGLEYGVFCEGSPENENIRCGPLS